MNKNGKSNLRWAAHRDCFELSLLFTGGGVSIVHYVVVVDFIIIISSDDYYYYNSNSNWEYNTYW